MGQIMGLNRREAIIEVNDVYKNFRVYFDKGSMLKEQFVNPGRSRYEEREILKGISFKVYRGETVALIGQNGCGKSTTLKMLTRILYPNKGTVTVKGKVSSLIELGAGFHPDMSGRENIYINASILGIKKEEVDKRIDEIIRFSELEEFIDNPIRTYSSGMYMRLAFSVAINVDADILLIDEILAVGDQAFQEKCIRKLDELRASGVTVVLVSHSMSQIKEIADRCIWIEGGRIVEDGYTEDVCNHYEDAMTRRREERDEQEEEERRKTEVLEIRKQKKTQHEKALAERKAKQEAFSARWKGGGTQGKPVAGVISMFLLMLYALSQDFFYISDMSEEADFIFREFGYVFYILGTIGIPMLFLLLGFELLGQDYSSWDKVRDYYLKTFLPKLVLWEVWVAVYQVFLYVWEGRPITAGVWIREALLIKYIDMGNLWTARFFILLMILAPFIGGTLQMFSARALRMMLIILWVFMFMFPGFDMYGVANGGEGSFPFYSGTVCYVFYFCAGNMISRYSQRMLKGSKELMLLVIGFVLTIGSQIFLESRGVEFELKPTYYGISIMAIMGFDLLVRVKMNEMYPRIAGLFGTAYAGIVGVYFMFRPLQMLLERYVIWGRIITGEPAVWLRLASMVMVWVIAGVAAHCVMWGWMKIKKKTACKKQAA